MWTKTSSSSIRPSGEMKAIAISARPEAKQTTRQVGTGRRSWERVMSAERVGGRDQRQHRDLERLEHGAADVRNGNHAVIVGRPGPPKLKPVDPLEEANQCDDAERHHQE